MKKTFLLLPVLFLALTAHSQHDYKPFRVDGGVGCGISTDEAYGTGAFFSLEPKYAVSPTFALGARFELGVMGSEGLYDTYFLPRTVDLGTTLKVSIIGTLDAYILARSAVRPFIGAGLGGYFIPERTSTDRIPTPLIVSSVNNFGGMVRIGMDWGHLRIAVEYNMAGKDNFDNRMDYVNAKVSIIMGGGRK